MPLESHYDEFTASGTFTVPDNVTLVWVSMVGAGGGGSGGNTSNAGQPAGGGGGGEYCLRAPVEVTPGDSITVTIGAKGTGGLGVGGTGGAATDGTASSFGSYLICQGGFGAGATVAYQSGAGGGAGGRPGNLSFGVRGVSGAYVPPYHTGGGNGGSGQTTSLNQSPGAPCVNFPGGLQGNDAQGGAGGASSPWGVGGTGGVQNAAGVNAASTSYGAGGGGAGRYTTNVVRQGGDGADGYCRVDWIEATP